MTSEVYQNADATEPGAKERHVAVGRVADTVSAECPSCAGVVTRHDIQHRNACPHGGCGSPVFTVDGKSYHYGARLSTGDGWLEGLHALHYANKARDADPPADEDEFPAHCDRCGHEVTAEDVEFGEKCPSRRCISRTFRIEVGGPEFSYLPSADGRDYRDALNLIAEAGTRVDESTPVAVCASCGGEVSRDEIESLLRCPQRLRRCRGVYFLIANERFTFSTYAPLGMEPGRGYLQGLQAYDAEVARRDAAAHDTAWTAVCPECKGTVTDEDIEYEGICPHGECFSKNFSVAGSVYRYADSVEDDGWKSGLKALRAIRGAEAADREAARRKTGDRAPTPSDDKSETCVCQRCNGGPDTAAPKDEQPTFVAAERLADVPKRYYRQEVPTVWPRVEEHAEAEAERLENWRHELTIRQTWADLEREAVDRKDSLEPPEGPRRFDGIAWRFAK